MSVCSVATKAIVAVDIYLPFCGSVDAEVWLCGYLWLLYPVGASCGGCQVFPGQTQGAPGGEGWVRWITRWITTRRATYTGHISYVL